MKKNNIIAVILVFMFIASIRVIGIENIPFPVTIGIMVLCMVVAFFSVLKYKGGEKERIYLFIMTILVLLLLSVIVIAVVIEKSHPQLSAEYKPIFISIMAILFFSLVIIVFVNLLYKYFKGDKS